jgi:hypothetical protein
MEASPKFDSLPAFVREEVFLHLERADLDECQVVSTAWNDFIVNRVKRNSSYVYYMDVVRMAHTRNRVFGKIVADGPGVVVYSIWMMVSGTIT